jgi:RNA polymerase sigma-70 factor (ECF subfamily)
MVFNLVVVEGMNHAEIAELLGIAESTSRANLVRARIKMQELVKNHYGNPKSSIEKKTA